MGDAAEMLLDGTCDPETGEWMGDGYYEGPDIRKIVKARKEAQKAELATLSQELKDWYKPLEDKRFGMQRMIDIFISHNGLGSTPAQTPGRVTYCGKNESRFLFIKRYGLLDKFEDFVKNFKQYEKELKEKRAAKTKAARASSKNERFCDTGIPTGLEYL